MSGAWSEDWKSTYDNWKLRNPDDDSAQDERERRDEEAYWDAFWEALIDFAMELE